MSSIWAKGVCWLIDCSKNRRVYVAHIQSKWLTNENNQCFVRTGQCWGGCSKLHLFSISVKRHYVGSSSPPLCFYTLSPHSHGPMPVGTLNMTWIYENLLSSSLLHRGNQLHSVRTKKHLKMLVKKKKYVTICDTRIHIKNTCLNKNMWQYNNLYYIIKYILHENLIYKLKLFT